MFWTFCNLSLRFVKCASLPLHEKKFCQDCQMLLLPGEAEAHSSHRSVAVTAAQLKRPSMLLRPLDNKKSNAQYLFTDRSAQFLLDTLAALGYRKVLCVGTPRSGRVSVRLLQICLNYGGQSFPKGPVHPNHIKQVLSLPPVLCTWSVFFCWGWVSHLIIWTLDILIVFYSTV